MKKFNNIPNERIELPNGRVFWNSRSVAVAFIVGVKDSTSEKLKFLLVKRGPGCPDEIGKYCLPCGYLDWNESAFEAVERELFEETAIELDSFKEEDFIVKPDMEPFHVNHEPSGNKQNVTLYFFMILNGDNVDLNNIVSNIHAEEGEVSGYLVSEISDNVNYAFNHKEILNYFLKKKPYEQR